ncbi:hypothetical protein LTR70_005331 [Exophiala xenobiotica]|uniref:Uncharacterized protein n=1 Tax=Lithohypha guttulata TaxID=1690604 RepID=A0ABR0K5K3_9EURO|nr:hypothetical protein LTR24_006661 [Lithohypha guttulata]KAK5318766.1 hypothetical protein LTR70_005331 [Exophiala xenobiotica]
MTEAPQVPATLQHDRYPTVDLSNEDYLERAKPYGISSIQQLDWQSTWPLRRTEVDGLPRLIYDEPYRSDMNLWHLLLDYLLQHHAEKAFVYIRVGLRYRGKLVKLSSEDEDTTALWRKMLSAALSQGRLREVKLLTKPQGIVWDRPHLFSEVVGTALRYAGEGLADIMAWNLAVKNFDGFADVLRIFRTFRPEGSVQMRKFCSFHSRLKADKMYDEAMHDLWAQERADDAFLLHKYLVSKGDLPSSFDDIAPFLIYLTTKGDDPAPFLRQLAAAGASFAGQGVSVREVVTPQPGTGAAPMRVNKVSDAFAAKAFATKALSFDFVLRSLQAFGLTQIGPQAMRELGLAASDAAVFAQRLARLDEVGVGTGSSIYSRIVRKLCFSGEHNLLSQALQTDMHHEVFENRDLLLRLLSNHLHNAQWDQVNFLLAVLNHGETQTLSPMVKAELVEEAASQPRTLLGLTSNSSTGLATFDRYVMQNIVSKLLHSLCSMKSEQRSQGSRLAMARFTAGIMQDAVATVGHMKLHHWRLLLGELGQLGALDEVMILSHWVAKTTTQESLDDLKIPNRADALGDEEEHDHQKDIGASKVEEEFAISETPGAGLRNHNPTQCY